MLMYVLCVLFLYLYCGNYDYHVQLYISNMTSKPLKLIIICYILDYDHCVYTGLALEPGLNVTLLVTIKTLSLQLSC